MVREKPWWLVTSRNHSSPPINDCGTWPAWQRLHRRLPCHHGYHNYRICRTMKKRVGSKCCNTKINIIWHKNQFLSEYFISRRNIHLEFLKLFLVLACFSFADLQYIETYCLTEWTALTNSDHITEVDVPIRKEYKSLETETSKEQVQVTGFLSVNVIVHDLSWVGSWTSLCLHCKHGLLQKGEI